MTGPELERYAALGLQIGRAVEYFEENSEQSRADVLRTAWERYGQGAGVRHEPRARDDLDRAALNLLTAWHGVRAWLEASDLLAYEPVRRMDVAEETASRLLGLVPLTLET